VAVIFTSRRVSGDDDERYAATAARMETLAAAQPGYLGIDSVHDDAGNGITVSYWSDDAAARAWKRHAEHALAQRLGRERWYDRYTLRVARVEREYAFARPIFHLALSDDWAAAQESGVYAMSTRGITVAEERFVHCSLAEQVLGVASRFYADVDEVVVLHLDRARLEPDLVFEAPAPGIDELFPHVYRPIPLDAINATTVWRRGPGAWADPPLHPRSP